MKKSPIRMPSVWVIGFLILFDFIFTCYRIGLSYDPTESSRLVFFVEQLGVDGIATMFFLVAIFWLVLKKKGARYIFSIGAIISIGHYIGYCLFNYSCDGYNYTLILIGICMYFLMFRIFRNIDLQI